MGRVLRVTLSLADAEVADFISTAPPALAGGLLAEVLTASTCWHIGAPYIGEDAAVAVAVVLLVRDRDAQRLLDAAPAAQGDILRRAAWGGWLFIQAQPEAVLWPAVAVYPVTLDAMRGAEDSAAEWVGMALPSPAARFELRRLAVN